MTDEQRRRALGFARAKAERVGIDLFEKRVCIACHDVRRTRSGPQGGASALAWTVPPVHIAATWMPKAHFNHASHRTTECKDCHPVERSRRSSDIALPDIESCRKCHAGSTPVAGKVVSTCILCHGYHLVEASVRKGPVPASPGVGP